MQFSINAADNAKIEVIENKEIEKITTVDIYVRHSEMSKPEKSTIYFELSCPKAAGTFSPCVDFDRSVNAGWKAGGVKSRYVSGMPLYCVYSAEGVNEFTIVISDGETPMEICPMVNEENGNMGIYLHLFTDVTPVFLEYHTVIRIDRRKMPFYDSISDASEWQRRGVSKREYPISKYACDPVYSTWYGFHRNINAGDVIRECRHAAEWGIKTLILDDGWYTDVPNPQFYYCGDWFPAKGKFPDMREFVEEIHKLGMKVMVWFSVPYVGTKSKLYERFSKMQIRNEKNWNCLDFRFPEVREYLYHVYIKGVKDWGIDGMKLDFIDSLYSEKGFERPSDEHDCNSLEEGIDKFLNMLIPALKKINPEFMIEFRQYYIGNNITRFADMVRVNDCPYDALRNRTAILGLRMICGGVPIHSDMIRWSRKTTVEDAALQIVSSLFSVLQISVRESDLTDDTRKMLDFYIKYSQEKRDILLGGKLRLKKPEMNYTEASVELGDERIKIIYAPVACVIGKFKAETVINASDSTELIFCTKKKNMMYDIYDCMGNMLQSEKMAETGRTVMITVPKCGMIVFRILVTE